MLLLLAAAASGGSLRADEPTRECRILAEVARSQFGFDRFVAPPLQPSGNFLPKCDWLSMGIKIAPSTATPTQAKLVFRRPIIGEDAATVSVLVVRGKTSGGSYNCMLRRGPGGWQLQRCVRRIAM